MNSLFLFNALKSHLTSQKMNDVKSSVPNLVEIVQPVGSFGRRLFLRSDCYGPRVIKDRCLGSLNRGYRGEKIQLQYKTEDGP